MTIGFTEAEFRINNTNFAIPYTVCICTSINVLLKTRNEKQIDLNAYNVIDIIIFI